MEGNWSCYFQNPPNSITVGQKLILLCDGESKIDFKKDLKIQFLDSKHDYSLVILRTLNKGDNFLVLEVTSYKTGLFDQPFFLTDGKQSLEIQSLSFEVKSLLTPADKKAQGSLGPFQNSFYTTSFILLLFSFLCLTGLLSLFVYRFFKRNTFLRKVLKRKSYLDPFKSFVLHLRKDHESISALFKELEQGFKVFLENRLLISIQNQTTKKILKNLKRYHFSLYKELAVPIRQILNEFMQADKKNLSQKDYFKLKKDCQSLVSFIMEKTK